MTTGYYVRMEGLEPPRREAPDPKSGAATNYATCAFFYSLYTSGYLPISIGIRHLRKFPLLTFLIKQVQK